MKSLIVTQSINFNFVYIKDLDDLKKFQTPNFEKNLGDLKIQIITSIPVPVIIEEIRRDSIVSTGKNDEEDDVYDSFFMKKKDDSKTEHEVKEDSITSSDLELDAIMDVPRYFIF